MKKYPLILSHLGVAAAAFLCSVWLLRADIFEDQTQKNSSRNFHKESTQKKLLTKKPPKPSYLNEGEVQISTPAKPDGILQTAEEPPLSEDDVHTSTKNTPTDEEILDDRELAFYLEEGESTEAWQSFHDHLTALNLSGVTVSHIECRSASCRLEVATEDHAAQENFLNKIGTPPFDQGGFFFRDDTGERLVVFANHSL